MNRIVREHYPASKLPEELRPSEDPNASVTVTIEVEEKRPENVMSLEEIFALRRPPFRSSKEIVEEIRRLRDDRDD